MVLVFTGVRKEELLGLQLSDVDLERKFIVVRAEISKSKRHRIIPLNSILIPYLLDYFHYRRNYTSKSLWVSGTVDRGLTEHGAKHLIITLTKVTKINCHLHRFRHTFATNYYKQTHDLFGLQKLMGHRSLRMTLSYLRFLPDEHLVEQIHKLSFDEFF
jgi:integrase/recombinase XerD